MRGFREVRELASHECPMAFCEETGLSRLLRDKFLALVLSSSFPASFANGSHPPDCHDPIAFNDSRKDPLRRATQP